MIIDRIHPALPPGARLEEYRLGPVLGAGWYGITYRVYDDTLDKFFAIKEYLPHFAWRREGNMVVPRYDAYDQIYHWGRDQFLEQARILTQFNHPNLNKVHRFFEANGTGYVVLEYIPGETLASRLAREPRLMEDALRRLLEEVLSGLAVVHESGYVHSDIRPDNLMLREEDGSVVVLDFGAARQVLDWRYKDTRPAVLTTRYSPIEAHKQKAGDRGPWSDIYALGMVAYQCVSGVGAAELPNAVERLPPPYGEDTVLIPAVEAGRDRYSPALLEAIDWAIKVHQDARPQRVTEWKAALGVGR